MKRMVYMTLLLTLLLTMALPVWATETEEAPYFQPERPAGYCGAETTWSFEGGTLTISGYGAMDDLTEYVPWELHKGEITHLVVTDGVVYIGENAFTDYDALESVRFGAGLTHIGVRAFKSCDGLTSVTLPSGFRRFGEESFMSCRNLTEFHCEGGMPSFNLNCLWDTYATIYYPVNNPWPLVHIEQLEGAFQGRIEFLAADGTDPLVPTEPPVTTVPTEPATEPATVPTTASTEPETEPTTAPTTEPATVPTEPPVTEAPETLPEPTGEPEAPVQKKSMGGWIGICIIAGALSLVFLGALIFRRGRYED